MRNAFRIFRRDLKRILRNPAALLVIIGVSIIPSLYAWFNIVANIDPYANTSGIKVAVANNDQEASSNGLSINAGDEIITNLKENDQLGWTFVSEDEAVEGVRSGKYYAAIVIPDKEFRYLRTVIVTAAVYWGLNSKLRCLTSPLNLPAPGRRQPIYLTFRFRIDLCFC